MNACPDAEVLQKLLMGGSANGWDEHIATCIRCQTFLDRAADDPELRSWRNGIAATLEPGLAHFVAQVRAVDYACASGPESYSYLAAPTRPGDLGSLGAYDIEAELGRGGMGVVFRAHDPALNRTVAIKVLRPAADDAAARARLIREARALAKLEHTNIVKVHTIAETNNGLPYLVLEYVRGQNLAERLQQPLPPRLAAELVASVADGLQVAHNAGLIHRDVKPANILLQVTDRETTPKITDFGLVRAAHATATATNLLAGTPAYMSPEQLRDPARIDSRADVYGLGATLYECLTGDVPFRGSSAMVVRQVIDDEPLPPRRFSESVPRDLEVICLKALAKEPSRRYASAADLAADLRRFLADEPIHARPASRVERLVRWARRKPLPAALSAALFIVALLGISGVLTQWRIAVRRAAEAEDNLRDAAAAVDQFMTRVSSDKLQNKPGLESLRKELLEDALEFYQRLLQKPAAGPALKIETARAANRAAGIIDQLRPPGERVVAWERATEYWAPFAFDDNWRDEWLRCRLNLGLALTSADRLDEAIALFDQLTTQMLERAAIHPSRLSYQRDLASIALTVGNIHSRAKRIPEATAAFAELKKTNERLLAHNPDSVVDVRRMAHCLNNWAMLLPSEQALPLFDEARAVQERGMILSKNAGIDIRMLARIDHHRGMALTELNRHDEARAAMATACQSLQQLCDASPDVVEHRVALASALLWMGASQARSKLPEAAATLSHAKSHYEHLLKDDPNSNIYKAGLASIAKYQRYLAKTE